MIYMVTFTINIPPMLVYIYIITIHGSYGIVITRPGVSVRPDCNVSRLDEGPKPLCISVENDCLNMSWHGHVEHMLAKKILAGEPTDPK